MNNIMKFQNYQGKNIGDMSDLALVSRFVLSVYQDNASCHCFGHFPAKDWSSSFSN